MRGEAGLTASGINVGSPLVTLYDLVRRARQAAGAAELGFLLTNNTHALAPYRQAVLWLGDGGVHTLSGVVLPEANAPYVQWAGEICKHLNENEGSASRPLSASDLPEKHAGQWRHWWPEHALWLPMPEHVGASPAAGLLLLREEAWTDSEQALLCEWTDAWWHAFRAQYRPAAWSFKSWCSRFATGLRPATGIPPWRQPRVRWAVAVLQIGRASCRERV